MGLEARGGQGRRESQASTRAPCRRPPSDFFVLEEVGKLARELISPNQGHKDCVCFASAALSKANIECYLVGSRCLSVPDLSATYLGPYLKLLRRTDYYLLLCGSQKLPHRPAGVELLTWRTIPVPCTIPIAFCLEGRLGGAHYRNCIGPRTAAGHTSQDLRCIGKSYRDLGLSLRRPVWFVLAVLAAGSLCMGLQSACPAPPSPILADRDFPIPSQCHPQRILDPW